MRIAKMFLLIGLASTLNATCFAADAKKVQAPKAEKTMSPEMKSDMSDMYAKMANCMKTDKSMEQCQKDIMKDCPVMKKSGHCPLMEGMKHMKMDHSEHQ